jgi:DNA-binding transcriptional regulator LsrR (DeoR family)
MARRRQDPAKVKEKIERLGRGKRRDLVHARRGGLDFREVVAAVCRYFCKGSTATEIRELMQKEWNVEMTREEPYQCISYAASRDWIRFVAPHEHGLREKIRGKCPWLDEVEVVHSAVADDVAYHGAEMLVDLLRKLKEQKDEVHVGFAGGHSMRKVCRSLAQLLRQPREGLPKSVVLHAMVAGFDVEDTTTDPNALFTYFVKDTAMQVDTHFVALHAPPLVRTKDFQRLKRLEGIRESYERAKDLDIVVTSASLWNDEHNKLRKYVETRSRECMPALEEAGCIGDMLWRPLGANGAIEIDTQIRAMTLMELTDLPRFIADGKYVLLVLGPCGGCNTPKAEMLRTVLGIRPSLITHLVVDSRTAGEVFP